MHSVSIVASFLNEVRGSRVHAGERGVPQHTGLAGNDGFGWYPILASQYRAISEEGSDLATTLERVQAIAVERLGVDADQVVESAEFIGDLNADSLDLVEVIMAMEQEFDLEIKDEDAENIRTVGDAVKYIEEHARS